jgi:hypothetical protein
MSVAGQKRRFDHAPAISGLHPTPDVLSARRHVSKVPTAEMPISFDNFNSLFANAVGDRHSERRCCLQVDAHVD